METSELIRKSPAVLLIKIIVAEALTEIMYVALHALLIALENSSLLLNTRPLSIVLNVIMSIIAVLVIIILAALWVSEGVYVKDDEIVYKYGVLKSRYSSYPYANMQRVEIRQGVLGKIFNFGTVTVFIPVLGMDIKFGDMSNPSQFAQHLKSHISKPSLNQYILQR